MQKRSGFAIGSVFLVGIALVGYQMSKPHPASPIAKALPVPEPPLPQKSEELKAFVEANKNKPSEKVQDRVGAARLRLAFASAKHQDWPTARATLLTAAKEYKGTNAMSGDFGGVPDQARYQAAICLIAQGQKSAGRSELVAFMKDEPLSPLATAALRRIQRLDGKADPNLDALLQRDIALQEKRVRFETSVCGPRCIEHLLKSGALKGVSFPQDYKQIAKLCGTTDRGTTVEQMRLGLSQMGLPTFAYLMSAQDLGRVSLPAILLQSGHYVVMQSRVGSSVELFDPATEGTRPWKLPEDDKFSVPVILFSKSDFLP